MGIFRDIFIVVKCLLIALVMFLGIKSHYSLNLKATKVTWLFAYYIFLMIILFMQEFFWSYIKLLYGIIIACQAGQIVMVKFFMDDLAKFQKPMTRLRIGWVIRMHVIILIATGVATAFPITTCKDD